MERQRATLLVGLICFLVSSPGGSLDLAALPRQIHKKPKNLSGQPSSLLFFGPNAEARVWVVIDGDVLFLYTYGNGDLTEPGERFDLEVMHFPREVRDDVKNLKAIGLPEPSGAGSEGRHADSGAQPSVSWFYVLHLVPARRIVPGGKLEEEPFRHHHLRERLQRVRPR